MSMSTPTPGAASELMPCPAGHDAAKLCREKHNQTDPRSQYPIHWAYVDCKHRHEDGSICGWHLGGFPTAAEAVAAWNTRTPAPVTEGAQREAVAKFNVGDRVSWWEPGPNKQLRGTVIASELLREYTVVRDGKSKRQYYGNDHDFELIEAAPPPPDRVQPERVEEDGRKFGGFTQLSLDASRDHPLHDYLREHGAKPFDPAIVPAYEDAMLEQIEEPTIKQLLNCMIASAQTFTDADGNVIGYRIRTGALHRLVGLLSLTIPSNLPSAPPNDASGGVTEAMVNAAYVAPLKGGRETVVSDYIVTSDEATLEEIIRTALEAADRARKPGYRQVALEDASNLILQAQREGIELEDAPTLLSLLQSFGIGAVIPDAGK